MRSLIEVFEATDGQPAKVVIRDRDGNMRGVVVAKPEAPVVLLQNSDGLMGGCVRFGPDGKPAIVLTDDTGTLRVGVKLAQDGEPVVCSLAPNGEPLSVRKLDGLPLADFNMGVSRN